MIRRRFAFKETFAAILADSEEDIARAVRAMMGARSEIEACIRRDPFFGVTFHPYEPDTTSSTVLMMSGAASEANVGPMAAVAGAIAASGVQAMQDGGAGFGAIDNGGDIAFFGDRPLKVGLFAGDAPVSGRRAFIVPPSKKITGICTSSATVGPSVSLGVADSVTVFASDPFAADAWATALCNTIRKDDTSVTGCLRGTRVTGFYAIIGEWTYSWGEVPPLVPANIDSALITSGKYS